MTSSKKSDDQELDVEKLLQELDTLKDIAARAQADLQNAKDRMKREGDDMRKFAAEAFILRLLPTIDNFQRAFSHLPEDLADHEWVRGLQAVEKGFIDELVQVGLKKFESLGEIVDSERHDVLQAGPGEKDVITEVVEEGYELNGKIVRHAKVKVGDGSLEDS